MVGFIINIINGIDYYVKKMNIFLGTYSYNTAFYHGTYLSACSYPLITYVCVKMTISLNMLI